MTRLLPLLLLGGLFSNVAHCSAVATVDLVIKVLIDGQDSLILKDNTLQWQHELFALPAWNDSPVVINDEFKWYLVWSGDFSNTYNLCDAGIDLGMNPTIRTSSKLEPHFRGFLYSRPSKDATSIITTFYDNSWIGSSCEYVVKLTLEPDLANPACDNIFVFNNNNNKMLRRHPPL